MELQTRTITRADLEKGSEGPPSISLDLGIAASTAAGSGGQSPVIKQRECKSGFTPTQLHELQQQALIFRYIVAGLPVPFYLVLSIWKGVACPFGSIGTGIYIRYLTFVGFNPQGFDYGSMMDPEPGRCRRTDGKKWRCSRDVVPDQKYCERHMHRGRQRSRKHVEASETLSEFVSTTSMKSINPIKPINSNSTADVKSAPTISNQTYIQSATPSQSIGNSILAISTAAATGVSGNHKNNHDVPVKDDQSVTGTKYDEGKSNISSNRDTPIGIVAYVSHAADKCKCRGANNYIDRKDVCHSHIAGRNIKPCKKNEKDGNNSSFVAPGFSFSPKSVLQGDNVVSCSSLGFDCNTRVDAEVQRCRRTDGRKWRCSKNVLPDQKYCEKHMHRGAKRLMVASQQSLDSASDPPSTHGVGTRAQVAMPSRKVVDYINTNLSISIAASAHRMTEHEDTSTGNSSSDATTITDENASVSHMLRLSP